MAFSVFLSFTPKYTSTNIRFQQTPIFRTTIVLFVSPGNVLKQIERCGVREWRDRDNGVDRDRQSEKEIERNSWQINEKSKMGKKNRWRKIERGDGRKRQRGRQLERFLCKYIDGEGDRDVVGMIKVDRDRQLYIYTINRYFRQRGSLV